MRHPEKKIIYFSCQLRLISPSITGQGFGTLHLIKQVREKIIKILGKTPLAGHL